MIYFLDGNQEVIKIARSSAVISAIQTQELPEDNSLIRDYLSVHLKNDERLFDAQYMAIKSYGGNRNAFDLYRIASELVPDNATEFMGVQVAPYELEGVVIEDLRPQNRPLNQTMNQVLEGSDWRLGYVADNLPNVTTNFYYMSVKDALKKIQELANVEMLFKVEISGNKITDKWVEVYHQLGNRTMKRFNYGTNALSVVRESSHDELYTALIGRGKGEEVGETESGDATYGRKINFADVEWKKSAGNPVDKPKGQKYIELPNATTEYGIKLLDGRKVPRIGIVEFNDTDDPNVLINQTYQELMVRARPKVLFRASVINTGDMLIGDTVTIHRHDLDFHYQARVRKVVRDRKNNNKTQVEIGDVVHTPSTKRQGQINSALNNVASDLENVRGEITEARQSADGKNTNFYGNVEPERKKVGDTWFRDHPSLTGESQILVWNGEAWELIMDTSETAKNAQEIEQAQQDIEAERERIDVVVGEIDTAVSEAGFMTLTDFTTNITGQVSSYEQTINGMQSVVYDPETGIGSLNTQLASLIQVAVTTDEMTGAISVLENNINARVSKGDVINQINISDENILIDASRILLNGDVTISGTGWLSGAVIANASMDGAKIQDATIGSAKIANLDVNKLAGNISTFIQSNWDAVYSSVNITGSSVGMIHSNSIRYNGYAFEMNAQEVRIGVPTFIYQDLDMRANNVIFGRDMTISANTNPGQWLHFRQSGSDIMRMGSEVDVYRQLRLNGNSISLGGGQYINSPGNVLRFLADSTLQMSISSNSINTYTTVQAGANIAMNQNHIYFASSANIYAPASNELQLNILATRKVLVRNADVNFYADLNMRGYLVTNQSDRRLKTNIHDAEIDSLEIIKHWRFVDYNWIDPNLSQETQLGLIAQDTAAIAMYNERDDIWNINSSKQIMMNSHAIQQLDQKVDSMHAHTQDKIHELHSYSTQALSETQQLRERIEELEQEIEQLKGAA